MIKDLLDGVVRAAVNLEAAKAIDRNNNAYESGWRDYNLSAIDWAAIVRWWQNELDLRMARIINDYEELEGDLSPRLQESINDSLGERLAKLEEKYEELRKPGGELKVTDTFKRVTS